MSRVAAIFDVDQTLVQGCTERLFFRYLLRHGLLSMPQALAYLGYLAFNPQERFEDKGYLEGLAVAEVMGLARQCYQEEIAPRVSRQAHSCVVEHQSRGHAMVLLTGSLSFLLLPLKEELGAEWLIATEVGRDDGAFTGRIQGVHPRGRNKLRLLLDLALTQGLGSAPLLRLWRPYPGRLSIPQYRPPGGGEPLLAPETPGPAAPVADPLFLSFEFRVSS